MNYVVGFLAVVGVSWWLYSALGGWLFVIIGLGIMASFENKKRKLKEKEDKERAAEVTTSIHLNDVGQLPSPLSFSDLKNYIKYEKPNPFELANIAKDHYVDDLSAVKLLVPKSYSADSEHTNFIGPYHDLINQSIVEDANDVFEYLIEKMTEKELNTNVQHYGYAVSTAIVCGELEKVKFMVKHGASLNKAHAGSAQNFEPLVLLERYLSSKESTFSDVERNQCRDTFIWCVKNQTDLEGLLLPLTVNDNNEFVKLLVKKQPGLIASAVTPPLIEAIVSNNLELVKLFVKNKADINVFATSESLGFSATPLQYSEMLNHKEIRNHLLSKGASTETPDVKALSPLGIALNKGDAESIETYVKNGADINEPQASSLIVAQLIENDNLFKYLLKNGADVNKVGFGNFTKRPTWGIKKLTPLQHAIEKSNLEQVRQLFDAGADLELTHRDSMSPLTFAVHKNEPEIVKHLIKCGVGVNNIINDELGALGTAIVNKSIDMMNLLFANGASVDVYDGHTPTLFFLALKHAKEDLNYCTAPIKLLQKNGAVFDLSEKDDIEKNLVHMIASALDDSYAPALGYIRATQGLKTMGYEDYLNVLYFLMQNNKPKMFIELTKAYEDELWSVDKLNTLDPKDTLYTLLIETIELDGNHKFNLDILDALISNLKILSHEKLYEATASWAGYAASIGNQVALDRINSIAKTSIFTKVINKIVLRDGQITKTLTYDNWLYTPLGATLTYKSNDSNIAWSRQQDSIEEQLGIDGVELEHKGEKYIVHMYTDKTLGALVKDVKIGGKKIVFAGVNEFEGEKYILFEMLAGIRIDQWKDNIHEIEDRLGYEVEIELYDGDHELFDEFGDENLVLIREIKSSSLPRRLGLTGRYVKTDKSESIQKISYRGVEDTQAWVKKEQEICAALNRQVTVEEHGSKILLVDRIEQALPSLLDWSNNKENPTLLHTIENNGNTDYFYSYSHDRDLSKWQDASRKVAFKSLFNQPDKVYKLAVYDRSNAEMFNPRFSTKQMIVLHEFASIPTKDDLMSFDPDTVLKDKKMFWGYGSGGSKYHTSIADLPHMMIIGSSGSGKSNFINGLILSLLNNISDIQHMYLVDLKSGIEFNRYKDLNPEKINVFSKGTTPSKLLASLQEVEALMYLREEYMAQNNIVKINEDPVFIIIDEYAQIQLMQARGEEMMAKNEIVDTLVRIGTRARSANIKLIIQTQDPRSVEDELKVHLMSRALLKTGKGWDMQNTLQDPDAAEEMGIKHTSFDQGRYVFEDYNGGNTQLEELQFPYIDPEKQYHLQFGVSQNSSSGINLDEFKKQIAKEYDYLAHTEILRGFNEDNAASIESSSQEEDHNQELPQQTNDPKVGADNDDEMGNLLEEMLKLNKEYLDSEEGV